MSAGARAAVLAGAEEATWGRRGIHAVYGRLDVAALLTVAAAHDDEHLDALRARGR